MKSSQHSDKILKATRDRCQNPHKRTIELMSIKVLKQEKWYIRNDTLKHKTEPLKKEKKIKHRTRTIKHTNKQKDQLITNINGKKVKFSNFVEKNSNFDSKNIL